MDECKRESVNPLGARTTNPENPHRCRTGRCFHAHPSQTRHSGGRAWAFRNRVCALMAGIVALVPVLLGRCWRHAAAGAAPTQRLRRAAAYRGAAPVSLWYRQNALIIGAACDDPASASGRFGTKPRRRAARVFARSRTSAIVDGWVVGVRRATCATGRAPAGQATTSRTLSSAASARDVQILCVAPASSIKREFLHVCHHLGI